MDSTNTVSEQGIMSTVCWSSVCNGECGKAHADTNVPERPVVWSWLPATPKPRYLGQWWSRGSVDSLTRGIDAHDHDADDMSNES